MLTKRSPWLPASLLSNYTDFVPRCILNADAKCAWQGPKEKHQQFWVVSCKHTYAHARRQCLSCTLVLHLVKFMLNVSGTEAVHSSYHYAGHQGAKVTQNTVLASLPSHGCDTIQKLLIKYFIEGKCRNLQPCLTGISSSDRDEHISSPEKKKMELHFCLITNPCWCYYLIIQGDVRKKFFFKCDLIYVIG